MIPPSFTDPDPIRSLSIRALASSFFIGKYVEFVSWESLLDRLAEVREFLEDVATAREVAALPQIDER